MQAARAFQTVVGLALCGLLFGGVMQGCGRQDGSSQPKAAAKLSVPGDAANNRSSNTAMDGVHASQSQVLSKDQLHQKFKDATIQEPPVDQWLPEITKTGKSVGKLYEAVMAEWDKVLFLTPEGKKIAYTATITTDLGVITIDLWPQIAPNHVRNFVALARAGYYDGLAFDRVIKREDANVGVFESLEAGCPVGSADANHGSIGYWLKPEFSTTQKHEAGSIGAWHGEEVESAACKFYINLSKAEWMDRSFTLFGKVTKGLDIVQAIHRRPVRDDVFRDRPVEPVVMRSVVISTVVNE